MRKWFKRWGVKDMCSSQVMLRNMWSSRIITRGTEEEVEILTSCHPYERWLSMSLNTSSNSLTQFRCWGSIMASSPKYEYMQGVQWKPSVQWTLLLICLAYKVIYKKYDDWLDRRDNQNVIVECPPPTKGEHVCACIIFDMECFYSRVVTPLLRSHVQNGMFIWSHRSKLALLWTKKKTSELVTGNETNTLLPMAACDLERWCHPDTQYLKRDPL